LFYDFTPKRLQTRSQFAACRPACAAARTYDYIYCGQFMLIQPERFTDDAPDSIAFYPVACHFDRDCQTQPRPALIGELHRHAKESVAEAPALRMNGIEFRLAADTSLCGKGVTNAIRGARGQWPAV